MKKYSIQKNSGVEMNLPDLYIDYNKIGMISAMIVLFWLWMFAPKGMTSQQLTYIGLEKYFLIVLCFIIYEKIMYRISFPSKVKIVSDGIEIIFKNGRTHKIDTEEFMIDNSVNIEAINQIPYMINTPVKLVTQIKGGYLFVIMDEVEISKLTEW